MKIEGGKNELTFEAYVQAKTIMEAVSKKYTEGNWGTFGISSDVELSKKDNTMYIKGITTTTYAKPINFEMEYKIYSYSIYSGAVLKGSFSCKNEIMDVKKDFSIFQVGRDWEIKKIACVAVVDNEPASMIFVPSNVAFEGSFPIGTTIVDMEKIHDYELTTKDVKEAASRVKKMILGKK